jgi:hypothetical protein
MGLQHAGHVFEANKEYTLSVWLKCKSGTLQINLKPELAASPWSGYGEQQVTITDKWAQYSLKTPVFGQDTSPGSITLHIGFAAGEFWVDGAQFYESAYFPPVEPPPVEPGNKLINGGFEDGVMDPWGIWGATAEVVTVNPVEGLSCLHVTVPQAGANFWDSGLNQGGHVFQAGKKYTLSAWLRCSQGTMRINFKPELQQDPWTGYGEQVMTMTDQWAEYSITTPVFGQDVSPASITFHIGFDAGDFWVDGARWYEGEYVAP